MLGRILATLADFFLPEAREVATVRSLDEAAIASRLAPKTIPCGADAALALLPYRDPDVKALLWALKYRASPHAAHLAARVLAGALLEELAEADLLVAPVRIIFVPRSAESVRRYGGNHLEKVAAEFPAHLKDRTLANALARRRASARQTTLKRQERLTNMRGAFSVACDPSLLRGAHVIAIDDVATTGATLAEAARALKEAGARSVSLIALAYS